MIFGLFRHLCGALYLQSRPCHAGCRLRIGGRRVLLHPEEQLVCLRTRKKKRKGKEGRVRKSGVTALYVIGSNIFSFIFSLFLDQKGNGLGRVGLHAPQAHRVGPLRHPHLTVLPCGRQHHRNPVRPKTRSLQKTASSAQARFLFRVHYNKV